MTKAIRFSKLPVVQVGQLSALTWQVNCPN